MKSASIRKGLMLSLIGLVLFVSIGVTRFVEILKAEGFQASAASPSSEAFVETLFNLFLCSTELNHAYC